MDTYKLKKSKSCCDILDIYFDIYDKKINFLNEELLATKEKLHKMVLINLHLEFKLNKLLSQLIKV